MRTDEIIYIVLICIGGFFTVFMAIVSIAFVISVPSHLKKIAENLTAIRHILAEEEYEDADDDEDDE